MADHSKFLETDSRRVAGATGFPYFRLDPALRAPHAADTLPATSESLLLAVHCQSGRLLVVSNKYLHIYQLPAPKPGLEKGVFFGAKFFLGLIPNVGSLLTSIDIGKALIHWAENSAAAAKAKREAEDKLRAVEGLPTHKDVDGVLWDFRNPSTFRIILLYKEQIFLRNIFEWKEVFKAPLENAGNERVEIEMDSKSVRFTRDGYTVSAYFDGPELGRVKTSAYLPAKLLPALQAAGWSVSTNDPKIVPKETK